jgi:hypothetical protein
MKRFPTAVTFHGLTIRASDSRALARRLRDILGWPTLRSSPREIVLGEGPELFLRIVPGSRTARDGVAEVHLAVKDLAKTRRQNREDALGGDSLRDELSEGFDLVQREFRRAPSARWKRKHSRG